ncbi:MAG TPA: hypothetical protein VI279_06210 [Rhodocyclaceae bacterium]
MKKIVIASLSAAVAGSAFAGNDFTAGPATSTITYGASNSNTTCVLLNQTDSVRVNLSTGNIGAFDCNATSVSIGVGVANTTGKNKIYSASSSGGGVSEASQASTPAISDVEGKATTAASSS